MMSGIPLEEGETASISTPEPAVPAVESSDNTGETANEWLEEHGIGTGLPEDGLIPETNVPVDDTPGEGGEEYELVKEASGRVVSERHKFVRMALVVFVLWAAYRLFFARRR